MDHLKNTGRISGQRSGQSRGRFTKMGAALAVAVLTLASGCATELDLDKNSAAPMVNVQQRLILTPRDGGIPVTTADLQPGDIVLSSTNGATSLGIRLLTFSPVSHAALYMGNDTFAEAVGSGIQTRSSEQFLSEESTVVAFRHPGIDDDRAQAMQAFVQSQLGKKYNVAGVVLQAPFSVSRQVCELPLVPGVIRDACIRGLALVHLGAVKNDRFFCSQFVLEAYRHAHLPLTSADPQLISPADLLHMREGDVPSVRTTQSLQYVGYLKADVASTTEVEVSLAQPAD